MNRSEHLVKFLVSYSLSLCNQVTTMRKMLTVKMLEKQKLKHIYMRFAKLNYKNCTYLVHALNYIIYNNENK